MNKKELEKPNWRARSASKQSDNWGERSEGGTTVNRRTRSSVEGDGVHIEKYKRSSSQETNRNSKYQNRYKQHNQVREPCAELRTLQKLSRENPDDLTKKLSNESEMFSTLLNSKLNNDCLVLLMQIISQMCCSVSHESRAVLLAMTCKGKFGDQLRNFVMTLPFQAIDNRKNSHYWSNEEEFWKNMYTYCTTILDVMPATAYDVLQKLLITVIHTFLNLKVSDTIRCNFDEIQKTLTKYKEGMKSEKSVISKPLQPRENFRNISLYPACSEITTREKVFLRKNVVSGAYDSVEHYLDVQFRLMREDFVAPLRKGICEYLLQTNCKKVQNIKIHPKVKFLKHELVNGIQGVLVQFCQNNGKFKVKYDDPRKFMFGSLLCFTRDNFKSICFGKIIDSDKERLKQGRLVVAFDGDVYDYVFNVHYLMIECKIYFEPYFHVLKALKLMTEIDFPMKEYLIYVTHQVEHPDYYRNSRLTFRSLLHKAVIKNLWPDAKTLRLNDSQYSAFRNALSQKFVIIQGPPGTGKTYLGLRIAKTLIRNNYLWKSNGPMLIVAYTNHALDQFLEGLLDITLKIVRIGGQSKNEKLNRFNIKNIRSETRDKGMMETLWILRTAMEKQMQNLKINCANLDDLDKYHGIVDFSSFLHERQELKGTWFEYASAENIGFWLFEDDRKYCCPLNSAVNQVPQNLDVLDMDHKSVEEVFDAVNREENRFDIDYFDVHARSDITYIVNIEYLTQKVQSLITCINRIANEEDLDMDSFLKRVENILTVQGFTMGRIQDEEDLLACRDHLMEQLFHASTDLKYLRMRMHQGRTASSHVEPIEAYLQSPEDVAPEDRWRLYFYWLDQYKEYLNWKVVCLSESCHRIYKEYEQARQEVDVQIMRRHLVIGMTTTGAARLHAALQTLKCPIVVVEEAAEILEAHTVASLTNHCQHLILIGDHQQLRPSTADYNIEKNFLLGISLFERMIINGMQCNMLDVQHRMRPEIAKLIVPSIYSELKNHESVNHFPVINGINSSLYFITHTQEEQVSGDNSKTNLHEAKFLLKLARYLVLNGYEPTDITILAAYSAQMYMLLNERRDYLLNNVRITVLDNYQGEESKIILLSLVRNNSTGSIGFLAIENRVCVALSRAKEGFYIMGNIDLLANNSEVWVKIKRSFELQNAVGRSLSLICRNHPTTITRVETADDFAKVPEGGCNEICGQTLACGHTCNNWCHILDKKHEHQYKCKRKCERSICDFNHPCPQLCFNECGLCMFPVSKLLPCGHEQDVACSQDPSKHKCTVQVFSELPCKHKVEKPCYRDAETFPCPCPCEAKIESCNHACSFKCHVREDPHHHLQYKCRHKCEKYGVGCTVKSDEHLCSLKCGEECQPCKILVEKIRTTCSHVIVVPCNINVEKMTCLKLCKKKLPCGHHCKLTCAETCGKCSVMVKKIIPECNHTVKVKCSEDANRAMCKDKCPRFLPCGHPCSATCKEKCTEKCETLIDSPFNAECGHIFKIPCHLRNEDLESNDRKLLQYCQEQCTTKLNCSHICSGTCGECHQGRIHKKCIENCMNFLVCGHKCSVLCHQICGPCNLPCNYKCIHGKCNRKCGNPCRPCKKRCPRSCKHVTCKARCGDQCTIPPCTEPCRKILKCGHLCIGFCSDPCPPLCRICNKRELTEEYILGFEDEEDARFVMLEECGHVIESRALEQWLQTDNDQITLKRCPTCHTNLSFTKRYSDYIKESFANITKVKNIFYENVKNNAQICSEMLEKVDNIYETTRLRLVSRQCIKIKSTLQKRLELIKKVGRLRSFGSLLKTFSPKIQIYQQICELFHKSHVTEKSSKCVAYVNFLLEALMREESCITTHEIQDFECELKRLRRILQLSEIEEFKSMEFFTDPRIQELYKTLLNKLYSAKKYNVKEDNKMKERLTELAQKISFEQDMNDVELKEIDNVVGVRNPLWYKCRNGHLFTIYRTREFHQVLTCNQCEIK